MLSKLGLIFLSLGLSVSSFAATKTINIADVESVRMMNHNNKPIKVLVYATGLPVSNLFVNNLAQAIVKINQSIITPREKLKLVVLDAFKSETENILQHIKLENAVMQSYIQRIPYLGDKWLQDFGEIMMVKAKAEEHEQLLLMDSNRGRGLKDLALNLSNFWNSYYYKPETSYQGSGNYGGNIEATPNNILVIGSTSTPSMQDFFKKHGYKNNHVILNTKWLGVGHVDEFHSTIITDDECGFAIVKASPIRGLELLKNSDDKSITSLPYYTTELASLKKQVERLDMSAENIEDIERSLDLEHDSSTEPFVDLRYNVKKQLAVSKIINQNIDILKAKVIETSPECKDIKIIEQPLLFRCTYHDAPMSCEALLPGTANMLVLSKNLVIPDPFFEPYRKDIKETFNLLGQQVYFVEDMMYHTNKGEIHCGTNTFRLPNQKVNETIDFQ